jgi:hypothetical protein
MGEETQHLPHLTNHAVFSIVTRFINGGQRAQAEAFLLEQWPTRRKMPNPQRKRRRSDNIYYRCEACVFVLDKTGAIVITVWPWRYAR